MQEASSPTQKKSSWPLVSLTPDQPDGPRRGDDALNLLSGFAARIFIEAPTSHRTQTEKRLRVLKDAADWVLAQGFTDYTPPPKESTQDSQGIPQIVRHAQVLFGPTGVAVEEEVNA